MVSRLKKGMTPKVGMAVNEGDSSHMNASSDRLDPTERSEKKVSD
jgi:hypothetical protein